ncbi:helix-turn-helix domain-containing protein [Proteus vulgaris]|nr:helix-turn-helix domain-containing protein [Proteus vulgaris]
MTLQEYIKLNYNGNNAEFARACEVKPQQITQWINKGFIVIDHQLYSPRRELPTLSYSE